MRLLTKNDIDATMEISQYDADVPYETIITIRKTPYEDVKQKIRWIV